MLLRTARYPQTPVHLSRLTDLQQQQQLQRAAAYRGPPRPSLPPSRDWFPHRAPHRCGTVTSLQPRQQLSEHAAYNRLPRHAQNNAQCTLCATALCGAEQNGKERSRVERCGTNWPQIIDLSPRRLKLAARRARRVGAARGQLQRRSKILARNLISKREMPFTSS